MEYVAKVSWLPKQVVTHSQCVKEVCESKIFSKEYALVANAVSKRRKEFIAGRVAARKAISDLGLTPKPILMGKMREPLWPSPVIGSITHEGEFSVASAVYKKHINLLGIDLATAQPLDEDLIYLICSKKEIKAKKTCLNKQNQDIYYKVIFSIKESLYKCLFPIVQEIFDFHDVSVFINLQSGKILISLENQKLFSGLNVILSANYFIGDAYIFSAVWNSKNGC